MAENKTLIGKDIIESLTLGMYEDPRFIYREYIQNSADQIDKAVKEGLLNPNEGEIHIRINEDEACATIEDNATGIERSKFVSILKNIAQSIKERGVDKGFRGIGRLGGLAYCDKLIFESSFKGEPVKSIMEWDAKLLKEIINNRTVKEDAADVIDTITASRQEKEDANEHYFIVKLINLSSPLLIDHKEIEEYLSMVAPVPFDKSFIFRAHIYNDLKAKGLKLDEYKIFLNTAALFKPYTSTIYKDVNGQKRSSGDEIFDIHFIDGENNKGERLYWGWYGISKFDGVIDDINPAKGIRLRKGNIQIGSKHTLLKFFRDQQRGNYYFFGEIHGMHYDLIPNARRDMFLDNDTRKHFEKSLLNIFHSELHRVYYDASNIRSAQKKIEDYKQIVETLNDKEFISKEEKEEHEKVVEKKKLAAEDAKKKLEKYKDNFGEKETVVEKIFKRVVKHEEIKVPDPPPCVENEKTVYRTDKLSKLTKEQRKLVSKIYKVICDVLDKKLAENVIAKIEEEFK